MSHEKDGPPTPRVHQLEDTSVRDPWDRQTYEDDRAWQAFRAFRDMNPRSLERAGYLGGMKVASAELSRWYTNHKWGERAAAYDVLTDRIILEKRKKFLEESVEDMSADQLATLGKLRRFLALEIGKLLEAAEGSNGPGLLKVADLKGLLEAEVKLTRLVKGETTEEVGVTGPDLSQMDPTELMAWRERLKANPAPKKDPN